MEVPLVVTTQTVSRAIALFVERAYKRPIWIVATLIALSSLTFVASYQASRPEENARLASAVNDRKTLFEDYERMRNLDNAILAQQTPATTAIDQFIKLLTGPLANSQSPAPREPIEENCRLATETRNRIESLAAKLHGTSFRVPALNDEARAKEGFLSNVAGALRFIEDCCSPYLRGDIEQFVQKAAREGPDRTKRLKDESFSALAQLESASLQNQTALTSRGIELNRSLQQAEWHREKGFLQIPAVFFFVGYFVGVFKGVRDSARTLDRKSVDRRVSSRHKKGRKN